MDVYPKWPFRVDVCVIMVDVCVIMVDAHLDGRRTLSSLRSLIDNVYPKWPFRVDVCVFMVDACKFARKCAKLHVQLCTVTSVFICVRSRYVRANLRTFLQI